MFLARSSICTSAIILFSSDIQPSDMEPAKKHHGSFQVFGQIPTIEVPALAYRRERSLGRRHWGTYSVSVNLA